MSYWPSRPIDQGLLSANSSHSERPSKMRIEVQELLALGPLPASDDPSVEKLQRIQAELKDIARPVSRDEAAELAKLFGPDDCFGLAWSLLHLIETAPDLRTVLEQADGANMWISSMWKRLARAG